MNYLFIYLIKSALSLALLYLSYEFFFRKEAYYKFSRLLLLSSIFLVVILPLLPYNALEVTSITSKTLSEVIVYSNLAMFTLDEIVIRADAPSNLFLNDFNLSNWILTVYLLGILFKLIQFLLRIYQLTHIIRNSKSIKKEGLKFIYTAKGTPTYSFLNWIFIDPEILKHETEFKSIISHEKIHAQQGHSIDLLLAELLTIMQWFNPFAYLLKNTIKENHEYITDNEVIKHYQDKHTYQMILLQHSSQIQTNILTHNFSYSLLERRIKMMKKSTHTFGFSLRLIVLASALVLIFFACSSPEEKVLESNEKAAMAEEQVFLVVEKMPEFIGGEAAMYRFIADNLNYPAEAQEKATQGRVFVTFVVEKDGQINDIKVLRGIGDGCDEETIRVIQKMPKWNPGEQRGQAVRVQYRMPIKYSLQGESEVVEENTIIAISKPFIVVEVMPEYPGGSAAMYKYIESNMGYPEAAKKAGTVGLVNVTFVIEKDGSITNVKVKDGIGNGCDEEAMRVIKSMPKWTPGKQSGKEVRVVYKLPIKFSLD